MCCYGKQARKFLSWLPEARSRSRGIQVKPDDVGDLGDQLGIGGEFERLGAPGLDSVVAPHPCHRAVADPQMLGQQPRTPVCDTVFLRWWRQRDRDQVVAVQVCVADRSGPRRTSPTRRPPNEERQVGRFGARVHDGRSPPPARRRAGAETEARPFHELLAPPRRLIRGGPRHAAIGIGPLDEKRMHHYSPPNRIDCALTQTRTTL